MLTFSEGLSSSRITCSSSSGLLLSFSLLSICSVTKIEKENFFQYNLSTVHNNLHFGIIMQLMIFMKSVSKCKNIGNKKDTNRWKSMTKSSFKCSCKYINKLLTWKKISILKQNILILYHHQ